MAVSNPLAPVSRKRKRPLPSLVPLSRPPGIIPLNTILHHQFTAIPIVAAGPTCSIVELHDEQSAEKIKVIDDHCPFEVDDDPIDDRQVDDETETLVINFEEKSSKTPAKKTKAKNTIYNCTLCQPHLAFKIW